MRCLFPQIRCIAQLDWTPSDSLSTSNQVTWPTQNGHHFVIFFANLKRRNLLLFVWLFSHLSYCIARNNVSKFLRYRPCCTVAILLHSNNENYCYDEKYASQMKTTLLRLKSHCYDEKYTFPMKITLLRLRLHCYDEKYASPMMTTLLRHRSHCYDEK